MRLPKPNDTRTFRFDGAKSIPQAELYAAHSGQVVTVVKRLLPPEVDEEIIMFEVVFADGFRAQAWLDELA